MKDFFKVNFNLEKPESIDSCTQTLVDSLKPIKFNISAKADGTQNVEVTLPVEAFITTSKDPSSTFLSCTLDIMSTEMSDESRNSDWIIGTRFLKYYFTVYRSTQGSSPDVGMVYS